MGGLGDQTKNRFKELMRKVGYDPVYWERVEAHRRCTELLEQLNPSSLDVLEISAGQYWKTLPFKSFTEANYPEFDICQDRPTSSYDLIIADQIAEHLLWPYRAVRHIYDALRPGGYFLNLTPFLVKVHNVPTDCTRWTPLGMKYFLAECGFPIEHILVESWGNRRCVTAMLGQWPVRYGFGRTMKNDPALPVNVWALAKK